MTNWIDDQNSVWPFQIKMCCIDEWRKYYTKLIFVQFQSLQKKTHNNEIKGKRQEILQVSILKD